MPEDSNPSHLKPLTGCDILELERLAGRLNEPEYRGKQLYHWIYARRAASFDQMTDLSHDLRHELSQSSAIGYPKVLSMQEASDGSIKLLFGLDDGERVETVYIPEGERRTICISCQVGCLVGCRFCATGMMGFRRNLTAGEMVGQLMALEMTLGVKLTNVVLMGMGEPLLNRRAVFRAVKLITDPDGIAMSRRRFTISTVGWVPGIKAMISSGLRVKLAISLNGTNDMQRGRIMPYMSRYSLDQILEVAGGYADFSGTRIALSYLLLAEINDTDEDADRLIEIARRLPSKVNLMEYNDIGSSYKRTNPMRIERFLDRLREAHITVTLRTSRGSEIGGACGQLAGQYPCGSGRLMTAVANY